ncbi:MAG TPA: phenylalanine--tRNA ligase subunit beta [Steroidobacteraceae bacterium]|nr:phenylalanine--tRNA ligase subunit beta [Steroidobacteraceae bacterium]
MKVTYRWLQQFTPIAASPAELAVQLTMAGLEVESVAGVAPPFSGVVVGEVLESGRHPDAQKLSLCQVTTDGRNRLQIVCGAKNVRAGLKVAVALVGAQLPNGVTIKRAMLRGQESNGMLCSARELGLGDDQDGIMELAEGLPLNQDLRIALDLDDCVLEVNATPNRGDCMSVFGIARDYSAANARRYLKYESAPIAAADKSVFPVALESAACPVFASRIIRGVRNNAQAPAWLRERLRRLGLNSISAIVDVTNYVMLEMGQPMHAYDLAKLTGGISVRAAKPKERITLLDDKEYELDPEFLVIADESGAIGLAGIMGGRATAISDATTDVLLESAHFAPAAIGGRPRRLGLFTDAAQRFERGVDPNLASVAIERASALLMGCVGGSPGPVQVSFSVNAMLAESEWVPLRRERLTRLLGASVPDAEVHAVMSAISTRVDAMSGGWRVLKPAHRFDIRIEADLIEEVARLRGFDKITESQAVAPQLAGAATEAHVAGDRLVGAMADRGYREIISFAFVDPVLQQQLFPNVEALKLANPIAADLGEMRVSLWPGLVHVCRENLRRQQTRVRLFEIGSRFVLTRHAGKQEMREIDSLAGIATGTVWPQQWGCRDEAVDFHDVKSDVMEVLRLTGEVAELRFVPEALPVLRPGRAARIYREALPVGWIGEIHPQLVKTLNLPTTAFLFELDISLAFASNPMKYKKISKFPSVRRDLAIVVDESVPLAVLQENVTVSASGLLSELRVFDVYRGPSIETGRKSIALGLILQDSSRTLTDVDADAVVAAVAARLRDVLSAAIRDQ